MDDDIRKQLNYLRLTWLTDNWDTLFKESKKKQPSLPSIFNRYY